MSSTHMNALYLINHTWRTLTSDTSFVVLRDVIGVVSRKTITFSRGEVERKYDRMKSFIRKAKGFQF